MNANAKDSRLRVSIQPGVLEIDEKRDVFARRLEVVRALSQMFVDKGIHALESHYQFTFDDHIGKVFTDDPALINDRKRYLNLNLESQ
jgi:hypothetical protein